MFLFGYLRESRRQLFRYWDGKKKRRIDPLPAWRMMFDNPDCIPDDDFGPATGVNAEGNEIAFDGEAQDRVLNMTRKMFGVKEWSESSGGLTANETLDLLWSFMGYMSELKKRDDRTRTRPAPSASESSPEETSPTSSESDLSSTKEEPTSDEPQESSKRSVQL